MIDTESRQVARDSLFIMAELRLDGQDADHRVKVRNISARGLMAEGDIAVTRGSVVWISLRQAGWVDGTVAWVQDNRFGVAFRMEIDPKSVRAHVSPAPPADSVIISRPRRPELSPDSRTRKII